MNHNRPLQRMFMAVPPRYDLINKIFTLGMDSKWRKEATIKCLSSSPRRFIDLCCGTGDLAINVIKATSGQILVAGIDYSLPMLEKAKEKSEGLSAGNHLNLIQGDASVLPFNTESIDCIGISFAFRNLTYRNPVAKKHLSEVFRVLKKSGRYIIVESSQPESVFMRKLFHIYLRIFVFPIGYILSGNKNAYRYLSESAVNFYNSSQIRELLSEVGFNRVQYSPLFFGAAGIHVAEK